MNQESAPTIAVDAMPILEARGVSKRFPGLQALSDVSLSVRSGEILGLVGENGAGKSTLLSVLSGALQPDGGSILLRGSEVRFDNYLDANTHGVLRAHQDQGLLGNMSVADNLYLGHEGRLSTIGILHRRRISALAEKQIAEHLHGVVAPRAKVGDLPLHQRQMVEIVRGFAVSELLGTGAPVVMLDEPTASLNVDEVDDLYEYVRSHRAHGAFVLVSHRLQEVLDLSDRIVVMKDGAVVAEVDPAETDEDELHRLMVGRVREEKYYREDLRQSSFGAPLLRVAELVAEPFIHGVSLEVREGEIFALGGVTGSGKSELARAVAGDLKPERGTVTVGEDTLARSGTRDRLGVVGYGPIDRHREGVSLHQSINLNVTLSRLEKLTRRPGVLSRSAESEYSKGVIKRYAIAAPNGKTHVSHLSGGNQQKVMLARLVGSNCAVLALDSPTRGVDAGARQEIYFHLRQLAAGGVAILLITDDLHELIGIGDRVGVMKDGHLVHIYEDVSANPPTEEQVVARMV